MTDISSVLAERGARYGDFSDHAKIAQELQDCMRAMPSWEKMTPVMRQALTVIADKIARIGSGDPFYDDNWIDMQGYAKLVSDRLGNTKPSTYEIKLPIPTPGQYEAIAHAVDRINSKRDFSPITTVVGEQPCQYSSLGLPGPG